jgi:uncharacterized protein YjbI with pentapeptide repeats
VTLRGLDPHRKEQLVRFLYEAGLITGASPLIPLKGAWLWDAELSGWDWRDINLADTVLNGAKFQDSDLSDAKLSGSDLGASNLSGAILDGTDLTDAKGITPEQLENQAKSLKGAIMPDGKKYEDYLKSKGRGEDGENRGPS